MAEDVIAKIVRANVAKPIASNVVIQISKMNPLEAAQQGADPHFTYKAYTTMLPLGNPYLVQFQDHVVDQAIIDPITHTYRTWLIVSDPNMDLITGDWKFSMTRMRGT
jgi:hypothetical protein